MRKILIAVLLLVPIFSSAEDAARRRAIETNLGTAVAQRAVGHPLPADAPTTPTEWLATGDIDKAMAGYRAQFRADPKTLPEAALNDAGYALLNAGRLPEAIAILQLNTELYPASANTYDSLGEVLIAAGQTGRAIAACEVLLRRVDADPIATAEVKETLRNIAQRRLRELRE